MPDDSPASRLLAFPPGYAETIWLLHAPCWIVPLRPVRERDAANPHPVFAYGGEPHRQWEAAHATSDRVIFPAGVPVRWEHGNAAEFSLEDTDGNRWTFWTCQFTEQSDHPGDEDVIFRDTTEDERFALLREVGTWTTEDGRWRVYLDDSGLHGELQELRAAVSRMQ